MARWQRLPIGSILQRHSRPWMFRASMSRRGSSTFMRTSGARRDAAIYPDSHTLRAGVTTVVDAGGSGWRTFPAFRKKSIEHGAGASPRMAQHRRPRNGWPRRGAVRGGHGSQGRCCDGDCESRRDRRHQDGALRRAGMGSGRTCGAGGNDRERSGDGGFRHVSAGASVSRARARRSCGPAISIRTCTSTACRCSTRRASCSRFCSRRGSVGCCSIQVTGRAAFCSA